jgi:hemoglobin/transferrin/lactoferrin receptor protein
MAAHAADESTLATVSVTAKGYATDPLETANAVEILEPKHVAGVAGGLFRGEPGLAVQSDGAWGQNPVLRGLKKESVVVLVDGVRVNSAQPQGAIASFLDLGLLDGAEVVKGPTSVLYGSGAMGGVVNLMTPDAVFRKEAGWDRRFSLGASSVDDGFSGAVLGRYGNADHGLVLGVAARDVGDYESPAGKVANSGYCSESLLLKSRHRLGNDMALKLNLQRHTDQDVWYPGSARTGAGIPAPLGTVTIHSPEQRRSLYEAGLEGRLGDGRIKGDVYHQEVFRQIRAWSATLGRDYVRNDVTFVTNGARLGYLLPAGDKHLLTLGAEGWVMKGDPERYMDNNAPLFNNNVRNDPFSDGEVSSAGLYVQDEITLGATKILAGARFDRITGDASVKGAGPSAQTTGLKHTDNTVSWSLGAVRNLAASFNPYVNVGQAYRAADMRERFEDSARGDGYYVMGNPQLEPEFSTSLEIGAKGRMGKSEYRLAAFHTRIKDYIAGRITGGVHAGTGLPIKLTQNLDEVVIHGVEGGGSLPVGAYVVDAAFTWLRGENKQDNEPLYQMPAPELRLGIGQPAKSGLRWRAQVRGVAKQDRVASVFSNGTENATPGFATADLFLGWGFGKRGGLTALDLDLAFTNLLDKGYHEHLAVGVSGQEIQAAGRGLSLSLKGSF